MVVNANEDDFGDSDVELDDNPQQQLEQTTRRVVQRELNEIHQGNGGGTNSVALTAEENEFYDLRPEDFDSEIEFNMIHNTQANHLRTTANPNHSVGISDQPRPGPSTEGLDIQAMVNAAVQKELKNKLGNFYQGDEENNSTPVVGRHNKRKENFRPRGGTENEMVERNHIIKSPSDTTIYAPMINKAADNGHKKSNDIIDQISNFVESMRMNAGERGGASQVGEKRRSVAEKEQDDCATPQPQKFAEPTHRRSFEPTTAKEVAGRFILESEKRKIGANVPQGMLNETNNLDIIKLLDNDDDFFHMTCHIEQGLKDKIGRGEYVDLEKLLPKSGMSSMHSDVSRMEWVTRDGMTYLAPISDKDTKINSIRKWEQAFRVYAAIYSKVNPNRSPEIWEYVYTINTAAASYQWENVAHYDYIFRQLMHEKPWRSWSKTYAQGWQLALKDPLHKSNAGSQPNWGNQAHNGRGKKHDWRDDCCWRYNKNRCKKSAEACHFDHRCTYCGGWYHSYYNCRKRLRNEKGESNKHDHRSSPQGNFDAADKGRGSQNTNNNNNSYNNKKNNKH